MRKEQVKTLYDAKYLRFYEFERQDQGKYYVASRREPDRLPALMTEDEFKKHLPDAVSCFVILNIKGQEKKLLLNREFRYPLGQYMLSVPAGIIDPEDYDKENAIERTAARELYEETGATEYKIRPVCVYSVTFLNDSNPEETFGMLYFADVFKLEKELHNEIEKIIITETFPGNWTYPLIQPKLIEEAKIRGCLG